MRLLTGLAEYGWAVVEEYDLADDKEDGKKIERAERASVKRIGRRGTGARRKGGSGKARETRGRSGCYPIDLVHIPGVSQGYVFSAGR